MKAENDMNKESVIRHHADADGITSGYFTSFKYPYRLEGWTGEFGDTTGMVDGSIMCDMHPIQDRNIIVIDHHKGNGYPLVHKYELYFDEVPASLIAWNLFKDEIPKSEWWKVCCGLKGDGQPELIPYEVYRSCPQLLNKYEVYMSDRKSYGKYNTMYDYVYNHLSSPVNAFLRMSDFDGALKLISTCKSPYDMIYSDDANKARRKINDEFLGIIKNHRSYQFANGMLGVIIFHSKYKMSGYIASSLRDSIGVDTLIAINSKDGRGSLRGTLSLYWKGRLEESGKFDYVTCQGHAGFMGFKITKNTETFIEDLTKLLQ